VTALVFWALGELLFILPVLCAMGLGKIKQAK
jgi:hypothetical protein